MRAACVSNLKCRAGNGFSAASEDVSAFVEAQDFLVLDGGEARHILEVPVERRFREADVSGNVRDRNGLAEFFLDHGNRSGNLMGVRAVGADAADPGALRSEEKARVQLADQNRSKKGNFLRCIRELEEAPEVLRDVFLAARDEKGLPRRVVRSLSVAKHEGELRHEVAVEFENAGKERLLQSS